MNKSESNDSIFSITKIKKSNKILEIINHVNDVLGCLKDGGVKIILMANKYEKLVPFNLWFHDSLYEVFNNNQNNQNMRIRSYKSKILTPLVANNEDNLSHLDFLPLMSLYQPFYPETFFAVWEFLNACGLDKKFSKFLNIGREERLGFLEALIFYCEKHFFTYQNHSYHCWITDDELFDIYDNICYFSELEHNYLGQAYKINFLKTSNELGKYDFINIDCIHKFRYIFDWPHEEMDLHATLFYLIKSVEHLNKNGCLLIRLNMTSLSSWSVIFDVANNFFSRHRFFRPKVLNPFNSEIYLFLEKFKDNNTLNSVFHIFLKNLYVRKINKQFYLNITYNSNNVMAKNYVKHVDIWCRELNNVISNFDDITKGDLLMEWHHENNLLQINNCCPNYIEKIHDYKISTKSTTISIKITRKSPINFDKLLESRAKLNYYKRVMDTKPSQIFSVKNYGRNNYLFTWESLAKLMNVHEKLKITLIKKFNAEMVTNAWIKMYEILNMHKNLIPNKPTIKTFHLCEAPGAFIAALNHYLSNRNQTLDWYAQTIKPTNNGSYADYALMDYYGLIRTYPDKWLFGDACDDSGDITHSNVIKSYVKNPNLKNIDFITADGGSHCNTNQLNEQETVLGKIMMGQIICILACLPKNKNAMLKTFLPMCEPLTISLMYLVTKIFENVVITKPTTSNCNNSEIYIILQKYKGIDNDTLDLLYKLLDDPKITTKSFLFSNMDEIFVKSYIDGIVKFINQQINSLNTSYYYYYNMGEIENAYAKQNSINNWISDNPIIILKNKLLK